MKFVKQNLYKKILSMALSFVFLMSILPYYKVKAANPLVKYYVDTQRIVFGSNATTATNDVSKPIITPLGYFVDVYQNSSDTTSEGQIFMTDDGRGAALYRDTDGDGNDVSPGNCTWISVKQVLERFEYEHSKTKAKQIQNIFATGKAYVRINSLMTLAKTTGADVPPTEMQKVPGWNPGSRNDRVAAVMVRIIEKNGNKITAANIRSDLSEINSNYTYSDARSINSSLRNLDIYSQNFAIRSGPVVSSWTNTESRQIVYSNLEVEDLCYSYGIARGSQFVYDIRESFYNVAINIKGYEKPNIKTNVYFKNSNGTTVSSASEGTVLTPYYRYTNQCTVENDVIVRAKNNYTNKTEKNAVVTIGANKTYTVTGTPFTVKYSSSHPHTETELISATATAYLSGCDGDTEFESNGTDNIYTKSLGLIIKTPSVSFNLTDYNYNESKSKIHSGEYVSLEYSFKNNSSYKATFNLFGNRTQSSSTIYESFNNTEAQVNANTTTKKTVLFRPKYSSGNIITLFGDMIWKYNSSVAKSLTQNIDIVPSDVQAVGIILVDAYTDEMATKPYIGQEVKPVYIYYNNTNDKVSLVVQNTNISTGENSSTTSTVDAYTQYFFVGSPFVVTQNFKYLEFTSSVYLNGLVGNTSYETNGDNNVITNSFEVLPSLSAEFLTPNSNYRPDTEVISTFKITNNSNYDGYSVDNLYANLKVRINGVVVADVSQHFVVPARKETLVWFKWRVPSGYLEEQVSFTLDMDYNQSWFTEPFASDRFAYGTWTISPVIKSNTPDTAFAQGSPPWFNYDVSFDKETSVYTDIVLNSASWEYYREVYGVLTKQTANITLKSTIAEITPVNSPSTYFKNGRHYLKSGYGFTLSAFSLGYTYDNCGPADGTLPQRIYALFPEFMNRTDYGTDANDYFFPIDNMRYGFKRIPSMEDGLNGGIFGTFSELFKTETDFQLPLNNGNGERIHYTPIWYPDSEYYVTLYTYDCWTPAGMLSEYNISNLLCIEGSLFDDYFIAGR